VYNVDEKPTESLKAGL